MPFLTFPSTSYEPEGTVHPRLDRKSQHEDPFQIATSGQALLAMTLHSDATMFAAGQPPAWSPAQPSAQPSGERELYRAVVRAVDFGVDGGAGKAWGEGVAHDEVVDAPAGIAFACLETV